MDRLLLRPSEAAEAIGLGRSKVYQMLATGEIPSVKVGGCVRIPLEQLREWIRKKSGGQVPEKAARHVKPAGQAGLLGV